MLFVEHDMDMVHEISDWVLVMAEGALIAEGTAAEISGDQAVIDAYLGAHHDLDLGADAVERGGARVGHDRPSTSSETVQADSFEDAIGRRRRTRAT